MLMTNPDSKFNGVFTEATKILRLHHHQTARGKHDAILVERFNIFLNAALKVFNNEDETNRVFVEVSPNGGLCLELCPSSGSRLMPFTTHPWPRFHFPINFTACQRITFRINESRINGEIPGG
jgi:hypothetical protein